jgi:squalene synthase HpnC
VFVALAETIRACNIPKEPFADLLVAFRQDPYFDRTVARYARMDEVLGYCRYSANPVGRLVLYACGEVSPDKIDENFRLSDLTCSALQLANFWQDVRVDFAKGRIYIPRDDMDRFGIGVETIAGGVATPEFRALMRHEVDYARSLFERGLPLIGRVNRDLALDLDLFSRGGLEILRAIERRDYDVLSARCRLCAWIRDPVRDPLRNLQERPLDALGFIARIGPRLRGVPHHRKARSQEFLLRLRRAAP